MRNTTVPKIGLDHTSIGPLRRQGKVARMAEHLGMRRARQPRPDPTAAQEEPHRLPAQRAAAFIHKECVRLWLHRRPFPQPRLDGLEFIRTQRLRRGTTVLESPDVEHPVRHIHVRQREATGFRDAQAVPKHQQQQASVACSVATPGGTGQQYGVWSK